MMTLINGGTIENFCQEYGGNDTKRPLKLKNGTWYVGDAGGGKGYDIERKLVM